MSNYLRTVILFSAILLLTIYAFNYAMNPFGLFDSPSVEGINAKKTQAYTRSRTLKAYVPLAFKADVLLAGNSRVELGLNPDHPAFKGRKVYNLGLPGADIRTLSQYTFNAIEDSNVKEVILSIDFVDFIFTQNKKFRHKAESYDFRLKHSLFQDQNTEYHWNKFKEHFAALFSLDALEASTITLLSQKNSFSYIADNGRMMDDEFFSIVNNEGLGVLFEQKRQSLEKKFSRPGWKITTEGTDSSHNFQIFTTLVKKLQDRNIKVSIFISPYHINYLQILVKTSMYEDFKRWKELLVVHLDQINFFEKGIIWDFSTSNFYTKEKVPDKNTKGEFMQWFWEPAHYRWQLGDKILDTLLLNKNTWGVRLEP